MLYCETANFCFFYKLSRVRTTCFSEEDKVNGNKPLKVFAILGSQETGAGWRDIIFR